ncbi:MAG: hypothetical protein NVSMB70_17880 [Chamaesiphon sp.]
MEEKAILIHYDTSTGQFSIEAEGFEGLTCLNATQPFEEALGTVQESDRTYKPEVEIQHQINRTTINQQHQHR